MKHSVGTAAIAAAVGLAAGGVAIGAGELVAVFTGEVTAPAVAVGERAIALAPASLHEFAIREWGTHDKAALLAGVYALLTLVSLATGLLARRWRMAGYLVFAGFGVVGVLAAAALPNANVGSLLPSVLGAIAGVLALRWLLDRWQYAENVAGDEAEGPKARREFLTAVGGTAAGAAVAGFGGKLVISSRYNASGARAAVKLPAPAMRLPQLSAAVHPEVPGLGPFFTPNADFYRVDTALSLPQVNPSAWKLTIHGMVDRPFVITYADLLKMPLDEHDLTLTCVSNPVGGPYCGNARWLGTSLSALLRRAGVHAGADQIKCTSTDGMTIGTATSAVMDGRDSMLAVAMNGEVLPIEHGFPCRMLVPGLYGYVSATKWVTDLELTTFSSFDAYWVQQGWSQQAPVKTESRIDVPGDGASVSAGTVTVAGTAWATHRGVDAVEVRVDGGPWAEAELALADTADTWRQWSYAWAATQGRHVLEVRATDATGTTQTSTVQDVIPNGATGYHTITVNVA